MNGEETNGLVKLGVSIMFLVMLISVALSVARLGQKSANQGIGDLTATLDAVQSSIFKTYQDTTITGSQVTTAIETLKSKNIAFVVVNEGGISTYGTPLHGADVKAMADLQAKKTLDTVTGDSRKLLRDNESGVLLTTSATGGSVANGQTKPSSFDQTSTAGSNSSKIFCDNGVWITELNQTALAAEETYTTLTKAERRGTPFYINMTGRYHSKLIYTPDKTTVIGILFVQFVNK